MKLLVKVKRYALIFATIIFLSFIWNYLSTQKPWELKFIPVDQDRPDLVMEAIKASKLSGDKIHWQMDATKVVIKGSDVVFAPVTGNLFNDKGEINFIFQSPEVDMKANRTIFKSIQGRTPDRTFISTLGAYWLENSRYLFSPYPVKISRDQFELNGNKFYFFPQKSKTLLTEGVRLSDKQGRVTVDAKTCEIYSDKSYFLNNVFLDYGDLKVSANNLEILRLSKKMTITDQTKISYKGNLITTDFFYTILGTNQSFLSGNINIRKEKTLIKADQAIIDNDSQMIELVGNIKGKQDQANISGEKALYDPQTKQVNVVGKVRLIKIND